MRFASTVLLGALALGGAWQHAYAARSYDGCTGYVDSLPTTISNPGNYCLRKDLSTAVSFGAAITVAANNITLDCNDFKLGGLGAGIDTQAGGIIAEGRATITVRNCAVRGFLIGIRLTGSGHLVEGNRLDGNTERGRLDRGRRDHRPSQPHPGYRRHDPRALGPCAGDRRHRRYHRQHHRGRDAQ